MRTFLVFLTLLCLKNTGAQAQKAPVQAAADRDAPATGDAVKYKRILTDAFPKESKAYAPLAYLSLVKNNQAQALIVKSEKPGESRLAAEVQQVLARAWGLELPVVDWETARKSKATLILFGSGNSNMPLRQLEANALLADNPRGYQVRTLPNVLDWQRDAVFLGGRNRQEVLEAAAAFTRQVGQPAKFPFFIACQGWGKGRDPANADSLMAEIQAHYVQDDSRRNDIAIEKLLAKPVRLYQLTGQDSYVKTFADMLQVVVHNYDRSLYPSHTPPSFIFHHLPAYLYAIENSPAFKPEDHLRAAEFLRKVTESMMDHWEMAEPIKYYESGSQGYLTNHACFASRSVSASARYLLSRYQYEPARYWQAVADNGFDGVAPHPFSPEDAAGYQYLVYDIFVDYALASGRYGLDFFKNPAFTAYVHYAKSQYNHLGYTAGFGDAYPTTHSSSYPLLKQAVDILQDQEAAYLVSLIERTRAGGEGAGRLPAPGKNTLGLNFLPLNAFKQAQYKVNKLYARPLLDKAILRSGWDAQADFMAVTGINGDGLNHGHFDANGISQYISGNRLWLMEGDYIKKFPDDHNALVVSRNGQVFDHSREADTRRKAAISQILTGVQTESKSLSLLSLLLEDYNGLNWTRNISYAAKNGFWVIDELDVQQEGDYVTECYWRSTGKMVPRAQSVEFVQKESQDHTPYHFFISEGNGAVRSLKSVFEAGHGRKDGNIAGYKYSDRNTRYVIQRREGRFKPGDRILYVNFMQALPGQAPKAPAITRLAPGAFLVNSQGTLRLAILGKYAIGEVSVVADRFFIGPEGVVASGATYIKIGPKEWKSDTKTDLAWDLPAELSKAGLHKILLALAEHGQVVEAKEPQSLRASTTKNSLEVEMAGQVSALAAGGGQFGVGAADGTFKVLEEGGQVAFEHKFKAGISAIAAVKTARGLCWAVAVKPENLKTGTATVHLLDAGGTERWKMPIPLFQRRNGTVTTLFTAQFQRGQDPAIVAGSQAWHYYAFDTAGKQLWRRSITHGATVGAAGDMDGDGKDDIAPGTEYYYHTLIDANGRETQKETTSPWDYAVAVTDLNNDGKKEAVFGRGDGFLYLQAPKGNPVNPWKLNVGGKPVAIVETPGHPFKLAVATEMGTLVFVDGAGKSTGQVKLPAQVKDLSLFKGNFLALCIDGFVYAVGLDGRLLKKYPYAYDAQAVEQPRIVATADAAAFFSGNKVFFINK
ncbi:MAG: hypothetical protein ACO1O1_13685 [Adhaeribacter sp.]